MHDIVQQAVFERRSIRFWHDVALVVMTPYLYGRTEDGDAIVSGITADGGSFKVRRAEMVGIEIVPNRHLPKSLPRSMATRRFEVPRASWLGRKNQVAVILDPDIPV